MYSYKKVGPKWSYLQISKTPLQISFIEVRENIKTKSICQFSLKKNNQIIVHPFCLCSYFYPMRRMVCVCISCYQQLVVLVKKCVRLNIISFAGVSIEFPGMLVESISISCFPLPIINHLNTVRSLMHSSDKTGQYFCLLLPKQLNATRTSFYFTMVL